MTSDKRFWLALQAGLLAFYGYAAYTALTAGLMQRPVLLALLILGAHVLEIPVALRKLRPLDPAPERVVLATIVFGLVWWIPASRGLVRVR